MQYKNIMVKIDHLWFKFNYYCQYIKELKKIIIMLEFYPNPHQGLLQGHHDNHLPISNCNGHGRTGE